MHQQAVSESAAFRSWERAMTRAELKSETLGKWVSVYGVKLRYTGWMYMVGPTRSDARGN